MSTIYQKRHPDTTQHPCPDESPRILLCLLCMHVHPTSCRVKITHQQDVDSTRGRCRVQRGVSVRVPDVYTSSRLDQPLDHIAVPICTREMQDRVPADRNTIMPRPLPQQQLNAPLSTMHLRRESGGVVYLNVDVGEAGAAGVYFCIFWVWTAENLRRLEIEIIRCTFHK